MKSIDSILITGVSGLLGRCLLRRLSRQCQVHALVRSIPGEVVESIDYIVADLASDLDQSVLPSRVDAVVHLAQALDARSFPTGAREIFLVNAGTTASLLDYSYRAGAHSFVLASTGGLYQNSGLPLKEDSDISEGKGPLSYYFASKRCAEILTLQYSAYMKTTIIRPFFMYGPGQRHGMLIPRLIENIHTGAAITVKGGEGATINPIFVDDAADAVISILQYDAAPKIVNVAGPEKVTIRRIAEEIGRLLKVSPIFQVEEGSGDELVADITLLSSLLTRPMRCVADGLRETIGHPR